MQIIYRKIKKILSVLILFTVLLSGSAVHAAKLDDGAVLIKIQENNLCFSVNKYKPRGYFIKNLHIGSQGFAVRNISVSKFQNGVIWGQGIPIEKNGNEYRLKPNQCIEYGVALNSYNSQGSMQKLYSGKFNVIISGYDPTADKMATFMSMFNITVTDGKLNLESVD